MKKNSQLTQFFQANPGLMAIVKFGDLVEATLIKKAPKAVYFDLGRLGTGVVYGLEFRNATDIVKNLKIGDKLSAKVVDLENEDGYIELSLTAAGEQKAWHEVKELEEKGEVIKVKITGANAG